MRKTKMPAEPRTAGQKEDPGKHPQVNVQSPRNANQGGEFLSDALRMEDLVLPAVEESIGVGSPDRLL